MLDRNRRILAFDDPRKRDTTNLRNWVENTSSLARDETAYLLQPKDLLTILSPQDHALSRLSPLLEGLIRTFRSVLSKVSSLHATQQKRSSTTQSLKSPRPLQPQSNVSRDPHISIFSDSLVQKLARSLIASLVVVVLLVPIIVLNALASIALRLAVIVIASAGLVTTLSCLTNAKTVEVFVSGAT